MYKESKPNKWEVGYRTQEEVKRLGEYKAPYLDLGVFYDYDSALAVQRRMNIDFAGTIETRIMETWE